MTPSLAESAPPGIAAAIDREWDRLAAPGTWLDGHQRVSVAAQARSADHSGAVDTPTLTDPMVAAARQLSAAAMSTRAEWVQGLYDAGLDPLEYVEILGIVARLSAVDTYLRGIGAAERQLPAPQPGEPTRQVAVGAGFNGGWAPTVGEAGAPSSLSAVPAESDALFDIHGAFYLSLTEMASMDIVKELTRPQMELVAARTSLLNDCFY